MAKASKEYLSQKDISLMTYFHNQGINKQEITWLFACYLAYTLNYRIIK